MIAVIIKKKRNYLNQLRSKMIEVKSNRRTDDTLASPATLTSAPTNQSKGQSSKQIHLFSTIVDPTTNKRTNERTNKQTNERTNKRTNRTTTQTSTLTYRYRTTTRPDIESPKKIIDHKQRESTTTRSRIECKWITNRPQIDHGSITNQLHHSRQ